jgi:hypothetical protein
MGGELRWRPGRHPGEVKTNHEAKEEQGGKP